jgi:tetratricopeptide (TPR) repeat protein
VTLALDFDVTPLRVLVYACVLVLVSGCQELSYQADQSDAASPSVRDSEAVSVLMQGQKAYQNRQFRRALTLADSAVQLDSEMAGAYFLRARIFTKLGHLDAAGSAYQKLSELDSSHKGLWFNWGNLAFRQGKYERAVEYYRREEHSDLASRIYTNLGRAYVRLNKPDSARLAYEKAVEVDSTNTTALAWLSQFHQDEGDIEQAIEFSRRTVQLQPNDPDYRYILGSQLVQVGAHEEAKDHLESVVDDRASHAGAHYNLGRALIYLGESDRADRHLAIADSLEEIESGIDRKRSYAQNNPRQPGAWIDLGNALRQMGRYEEALQAYESARALVPTNVGILNNIAGLYLETGDTTRALQQYHAILRRDSTSADTWFNLGVLHANRGEREKARNAWEQVLKYRPSDTTTRKYLHMLE